MSPLWNVCTRLHLESVGGIYIRDILEETLNSFTDLQEKISIAVKDIGGQLKSHQEQPTKASDRLKRFKSPTSVPVKRHEIFKEQDNRELPFDEEDYCIKAIMFGKAKAILNPSG